MPEIIPPKVIFKTVSKREQEYFVYILFSGNAFIRYISCNKGAIQKRTENIMCVDFLDNALL